MAIYRQFDGLVALPCVGWTAPFSTRRVDFLSIKLGIRTSATFVPLGRVYQPPVMAMANPASCVRQ